MKRFDKIKLEFTRNWMLPGKERLTNLFKPSPSLKAAMKEGITWLTDEDIAVFTSADNYIEWQILSNGTYENEIGKLIRISIPPGGVAIDIGANIGLQSMRMSRAAGAAGKVFAFEPLSHLSRKLASNLSLNAIRNVVLYPFALSDAASETYLPVNKDAWNQGTFSIGKATSGAHQELISIKVGDEIPDIQRLERLDLVKIDVEGFEVNVMKGIYKTLEKFRPRIIFEYDENYWAQTGLSREECAQMLKTLNYAMYEVTAVGCTVIDRLDNIRSANIFCIADAGH
jgi:FkbM family methyltransferase